nr:uncharacterized protein LOC112936997 [Oryza sativa Japonica Group]
MHVETERMRICMQLTADAFLHRDPEDWERKHDVVAGVVSHPAARRVEELRVAAAVVEAYWPSFDGEVTSSSEGEFRLCLDAQPSETLRVLDLAGCGGLSAAAAAAGVVALPRLTTLRLRLCNLQISDLQGIIDAAPELATVHLESVFLAGTAEEGCVRLRFPAATTALAMINCGADCYACGGCYGATEIDAPRLRSFKYTGFARRFSLVSPAAAPPPDDTVVARAELHFLDHFHHKDADAADTVRANFWLFLHNFRGAKSLKLKVSHLKHIAVAGRAAARRALLLPLHGVERLDLTARHADAARHDPRPWEETHCRLPSPRRSPQIPLLPSPLSHSAACSSIRSTRRHRDGEEKLGSLEEEGEPVVGEATREAALGGGAGGVGVEGGVVSEATHFEKPIQGYPPLRDKFPLRVSSVSEDTLGVAHIVDALS